MSRKEPVSLRIPPGNFFCHVVGDGGGNFGSMTGDLVGIGKGTPPPFSLKHGCISATRILHAPKTKILYTGGWGGFIGGKICGGDD